MADKPIGKSFTLDLCRLQFIKVADRVDMHWYSCWCWAVVWQTWQLSFTE